MAHHDLKTHTAYFEDILSGDKTFEVRKNDRDFKVGDTVTLKEVELSTTGNGERSIHNDRWYRYTGRQRVFRISYIFGGGDGYLGLEFPAGVVVLGLRPPLSLKNVSKDELGRALREAVYGGNDELFGETE